MKLIGIHGKAKSGKDELCKILLKINPYFKHIYFAEEIKKIGIRYFGLKPTQVYERKIKKSRAILQSIGSSVRNYIDKLENVDLFDNDDWANEIAINEFGITQDEINAKRQKKHVKIILEGILNLWCENYETFKGVANGRGQDIWVNFALSKADEEYVYIITDVRFQNEKERIRNNNGKVVKIIRTDLPPIEAGADHPTETSLDNDTDWDFEILNDGTKKKSWRELLAHSGYNMLRTFIAEGFFEQKIIDAFKFNLIIEE